MRNVKAKKSDRSGEIIFNSKNGLQIKNIYRRK